MSTKLCTYSRSDLLADSILPECPLELSQAEHDYCPCKTRVNLTKGRTELRVLSCTYPRLWDGREPINPPAFWDRTRERCAHKVEMERLMAKQKTTTADPAPAPALEEALAPEGEVTAMVPAGDSTARAIGQAIATMQAAPSAPRPKPSTLAAALAEARRRCRAVASDRRNAYHKYDYASAETVLLEAQQALEDTGLAVVPLSMTLSEDRTEMERQFLILHESGESLTALWRWPVVVADGRPIDKAVAISCTSSLHYFIRDLLLMPRVKAKDDLAARKDPPAPTARDIRAQQQAAQAAAAKPAAPAPSKNGTASPGPITEQQLQKLSAKRLEVFSVRKPADQGAWWKEFLERWKVDSARELTEAQAREALDALAHELTTADMEAACEEGKETVPPG